MAIKCHLKPGVIEIAVGAQYRDGSMNDTYCCPMNERDPLQAMAIAGDRRQTLKPI